MANILLASKNALDSGVNWYGDADVSWPLTNLQDPVFSKVWRFTPGSNSDGNVARFAMSMGLIRTNHLALPAHNMGQDGQIRLRAGTARFDADFTTDVPFTHDLTFGGGANGTRTNEYGVMVSGTCPRYEHDRRFYDNGFKWSQDLTQADWETQNAVKSPDGQTVTFMSGGTLRQSISPASVYADTYEIRALVQLVEGDGTIAAAIQGVTSFGLVAGSSAVATTDWSWVTMTVVAPSNEISSAIVAISKTTAAGVIRFRKLQFRRGASGGKYRKTTTLRRYQRLGVIVEAGATNSLVRSAEYDNAAWTKSGVTVSANQNTAPDGTVSVDTLTGSVANQFIEQSFAAGGTTTRATSLIFTAGGTSTSVSLAVLWDTGGVLQFVSVAFNALTGAFLSTGNSGATLIAGGVRDIGNGYFRAYVIGTGTNAANTVVRTRITFNNTGTLAAWGSQNEANYVTSYIPTVAAAVTRTVDTAVVEAATWVPYAWNAAEGTVYHEGWLDEAAVPNNSNLLGLKAVNGVGGNNSLLSFLQFGAGAYAAGAFITVGGVLTFNSTAAISAGQVVRHAYRYRASDFASYVNGASAGTSGTSVVPTGITVIDLMNAPTATAYLRRAAIWPPGKVNTEVQAASASGPGAIDFDSGWDDVMQAQLQGDVPTAWGKDYDILKTFPMRSVEWMRVELYDPAKTSNTTTFDVGRAFVGKLVMQPAKNAQYGMQYSWRERTTFDESIDGRKFFNERPRIREVAFAFPKLTPAEAARIHEIQGSGGISQEVIFLPDPDDEAECQRYGFVGYLSKLDPLTYPLINVRAGAFQIEKKR